MDGLQEQTTSDSIPESQEQEFEATVVAGLLNLDSCLFPL